MSVCVWQLACLTGVGQSDVGQPMPPVPAALLVLLLRAVRRAPLGFVRYDATEHLTRARHSYRNMAVSHCVITIAASVITHGN